MLTVIAPTMIMTITMITIRIVVCDPVLVAFAFGEGDEVGEAVGVGVGEGVGVGVAVGWTVGLGEGVGEGLDALTSIVLLVPEWPLSSEALIVAELAGRRQGNCACPDAISK